MRSTSIAIVAAAGLALFSFSAANAGPVSGTAVGQSEAITLVADGCGRGRHYSKYQGMCVGNGGGNGYRVYVNPGYRNYGYRSNNYPAYGYNGRNW